MTTKPIYTDSQILGGTPVFTGTRVPVQSLFNYIENGETLDEFLANFPSVEKQQAIEVLQLAEKLVTSDQGVNENPAWRKHTKESKIWFW